MFRHFFLILSHFLLPKSCISFLWMSHLSLPSISPYSSPPSFLLSVFKVGVVYSQGPHQPYSPLNFAVCKLCTCFINSPSPNNPVKAALLRSHFMGDHVQKDKSLALGHIVQSVLELDLNTGCLS